MERATSAELADRPTTLNLDTHIPALLTWVANKLGRGASAEYRSKFGVGVTEWRVIALLAIEPEISANRIVEVIGLNKGATSRSLRMLESRGLVSIRASGNGRNNINALTEAGRQLHDRILPVALAREQRLVGCLSQDELNQLIATLHRLHASLPKVDGGPENQDQDG
ncbi:MAG: MarR family transcriptional regulator [Aquisalimonadaceae bacterium]